MGMGVARLAHTQPGPASSSNPVKGRPFRSRRTGSAMQHADWADPPTMRLTRALHGHCVGRDRVRRLPTATSVRR